MTTRLHITMADFSARFDRLCRKRRQFAFDDDVHVGAILDDVQKRGDAALIDYTKRFDNVEITSRTMRVDARTIAAAADQCDPSTLAALKEAHHRITRFHQRQKPSDDLYHDEQDVFLALRWRPVESVGIYVPGGTALYPSSVLMNGIPARVAGVGRIVMVSPVPQGPMDPLVLAAAHLIGVEEIYRIGGAHAIAAMAWGTRTIAPVTKIVGPGNRYVAAAKRQVFGMVGIDMIAGPSEVLIVADAKANPSWIAADLLSQAEHDENAQSILISDNADFADRVCAEIKEHLKTLPRANIAAASWNDHGAVIILDDLDKSPPLIDAIAPEHLQLVVPNPRALADRVHYAGSIFLGAYTPEAIGDYIAGPNHVLPTCASARFSSALGVHDFMVRHTMTQCNQENIAAIGPAAELLAKAEGLDGHARSIAARLPNDLPNDGPNDGPKTPSSRRD